MTIIEKILAAHSGKEKVFPGDILDVKIDLRLARDFGGANVVKNLDDNGLKVEDASKTYFTFDCNPTGSDQDYAANQQLCRQYARNNGIGLYDINSGIGTHLAIDAGLAMPGYTVVSTDSHANILGAIGAFGQGMGDRDIAAAWARGAVWYKVPESVKITLTGKRPEGVYAKDVILNLLKKFGSNSLLGYSVELAGEEVEMMNLSDRITISSMATEMGAIAILIPPSEEIARYCELRSGKKTVPVFADPDAQYASTFEMNLNDFFPAISLPGKPHHVVSAEPGKIIRIDSAFIGSCTNGRIEDMRVVARILRKHKVAPGVILKIVPSTDEVWNKCLREGLIDIFKHAGAMVSNAGCAGCAAGQVGQNGPGEITVSTGNRNFSGKQGKGDVYLASPATATASAVSGYITTVDKIAEKPLEFASSINKVTQKQAVTKSENHKPTILEGKVWIIDQDDIDTDMIYHNKHLSITNINEMGQYTFGNLKGWEEYAKRSEQGDIVIAGKNFGAGSSRQHAVDCFRSLGNQAILAQSFGAIYERNAINAGFPLITYKNLDELELANRDIIRIDLVNGSVTSLRNGKTTRVNQFYDIQMMIYQRGDLLKL